MTGVPGSTSPMPRPAREVARRALPLASILALAVVMLIPTWVVLPPDDEGLYVAISPTLFTAKHLFGSYALWNPFVAFGGPIPGAESVIFHPFLLLVRWASLGFSIGALYQVQLWIALVSLWALCRFLGMRQLVVACCAVTYALSTASLELLYNFWPDEWVAWTLAPLLLLCVLKLLDSERRGRRAFFSVGAGLTAALMLLDGHAGIFPVWAVAIVVFLIAEVGRARRVAPWLGLALGICIVASSTRIFDLSLETALSPKGHLQQVYPFDFPHFFLYPLYEGVKQQANVAFGLPFVLLAAAALVWRGASGPYTRGFRVAAVVLFLAWFLPTSIDPILSANWLFGEPLTLVAILLAGSMLERLWRTFPSRGSVLTGVIVVQVAILAAGFYGLYRVDLHRTRDFLAGKPTSTLKNVFGEHPVYRYFESRPDHATTRVLLSPDARVRLWRTLTDYEWTAWEWHGLRLLNGHLRGDDTSDFQLVKEALHGEIRGEPDSSNVPDDLTRARTVLDTLNVGYVVAAKGEPVAPGLVAIHHFWLPGRRAFGHEAPTPVHHFPLPHEATSLEVYRNPTHWLDAEIVAPQAKRLTHFTQRPGCGIQGLLCDDLAPVHTLRRQGVVAARWHGTTLDVALTSSPETRVLMISQMYRPGWQARLSDGKTVVGYELFGSVTGFDIPPGATSARISFEPSARIAFAALSWAAVLASMLFLLVAGLRRWHREEIGDP
jgi:hypothetical protein